MIPADLLESAGLRPIISYRGGELPQLQLVRSRYESDTPECHCSRFEPVDPRRRLAGVPLLINMISASKGNY